MHRSLQFLLIPLTLGLLISASGCSPAKGGGGQGGNSNPSGGSASKTGGTTGNPSGGATGNPSGGTTGNPSGGTTTISGGTTGNPSGGATGNPSGGTTGNPSGGTTTISGGTTGISGGSRSGGSTSVSGGTTTISGGTTTISGGTTTISGGTTTISGGTTTISGGSRSGGTTSVSGGTTTISGGTTTVTGGTTSPSGGSTAGSDMISDFESGKGDMIQQSGRTGYWYVYFPGSGPANTPASPMSISPPGNNGVPINVESSDTSKYALHVTGSGFTGATNGYAGFGGFFKPATPFLASPTASSPNKNGAYDVSSYTGITFKMKSGSGTPPAMFFEMLTKENQPSSQGGNLNPDAGAGPDRSIGLYNTRGWLINTPWTPNAISSSWQTVTVPFGYLVPRHLTDSATCTSTSSATAMCQPPAFVPADVLGLQVSFYDATSTNGAGFPTPSGSTPGTFNIWIDDVAFTTGDSGLQTISGFPLTSAGSMGSCKLPTGPAASAKYLVPAYNQWKANFVKGGRVVRPEAANDTVSEGQAYGMLIAVNFNDKTLFDSLYSTWTSNIATGTLMNWCLGSSGGGTGSACSASGGSATDADEDAAFALLQAAKVFNDASYKTKAMTMISDIWNHDIDSSTKLPKGGSNYTSSATTNPSYFAPAYYTAFKAAGDTNDWASVNTAVYAAVNASVWSNGLLPAWCSGNTCTAPGSNPGSADPATDGIYQYDAHRIPMRIGLDYCFNGTAAAKTYTGKTTTFFATNANAGLHGIGRIFDMYQLNGTAASNTANNAASIIGTAAVGAMADGSNQKFINDAYQEVFDVATRSSMSTVPTSTKTPYSYYNATVGLLTMLMMTGNFSH